MKKVLQKVKIVTNKIVGIAIIIIFAVAFASFFVGICKIGWYGLTRW